MVQQKKKQVTYNEMYKLVDLNTYRLCRFVILQSTFRHTPVVCTYMIYPTVILLFGEVPF